MKFTAILLFAAFLQVHAEGYGQSITLEAKNAPLENVLREIQEQTGYAFLYSNDDLKLSGRINLQLKSADIEKALESCFQNQPLTYTIAHQEKAVVIKRRKKPVLPTGFYQDIAIEGTVTDTTGAPLPGVSVQVRGTQNGVSTDMNGHYALINVPENAALSFSIIGYQTREIPVNGRGVISIRLRQDVAALEEVVIVGYGAVKRSDLTGSVSSIGAEKVTQVNAISNVAQVLQGQMAGVQVNQASGQPGEFMRIKIRGTNSIGASNAPLYVVDGLPLDNLTAQFNSNDIERIEVLKDASATAIYGSRGANGVILITTKKGQAGKPRLSYDGYYGIQTLRNKIELVNAEEFAVLQNEVAINDGAGLPWTEQQIAALGEGTDWQEEVYNPAPTQNHNLSLSGGTENTKYYTSFGYFDQDGIIENSGFRRFSFRGNLDQKISDKLNFNTSLSLQNSKYVQANYTSADGNGGVPFTAMVMPPTKDVYNADGSYTRFTGVPWGQTNPVGMSRELYNPSFSLRILGNAVASYQLSDGLTLRLSAGIDNSNDRSDYYAPAALTIGQRTDKDGNPISGVASKSYSNSLTFINENTLSYQKQLNGHGIDAVAGLTYQSNNAEGLNSGTAIGFISDLYKNNNIGSAVTLAQPGSYYNDYKLISYLGRINYNYKGKYYATFTSRYDGSSRFGKNNKFAFFPSGALAWRVSEEDFLSGNSNLSNLKLRVSYGTSGNQAIGSYQTLARMSDVNVVLDNTQNTGFVPGSLENSGLKWETTRQFDAGVDLGLFNNRIELTADYYSKKTSDLLLNVTLPPSSGYGSILQNAGVVQNRGFEFQLISQNLTGVFNWSSVLTFSHNRTKVLDLGKDAQGEPITYKEIGPGGNWFPTIVGESMMQFYGYTVEGVYQTDQEAIDNGEPTKHAGDYRFKNWDGVGIVNDAEDRTVLSHLEPKFTFGFNNSFSYKNFNLSLLFVGSYGNDIVNEFRKYNITMNGKWAPSKEAYDQRWTGAGSSNAIDKPSSSSASSIRDYANSLWLEDGSYIRLRDITLGYTFSARQLSFAKVSSLQVYLSAQNWLTITDYSGYDPEVSWAVPTINGWDRGNYPSVKSITMGVKINF